MLDDYKNDQKIVYQILKNTIKKDRLSHAYLFETKGNHQAELIALSFAKYILCPNNNTTNTNCGNCTQCSKIDKNIFSELKIIEPDGLWIKKEQLDELQKNFSYKAIEATKKVYIIKQADRLNQSSANSILKFLEEPEPNIIAILLVDNLYQVMDTIASRCQIINFNKNILNDDMTYIEKINSIIKNPYEDIENAYDEIELKINNVIKFVNYIEEKQIDSILATNKLFHDNFKEKEEVIFAFNIMSLYYKDLINEKLSRKKEIFNYIETEKITKKNSLHSLEKKLLKVLENKEKINYNANTNLLIDRLIIDIVGGV